MSEASNDVMQLGNAYRGPVRSIGTNMNVLPDGTPVVNYYGQGYITREQNPQYFDSIYGREPSQGGLLGAMDMKDIATAASMFAAAYGGGQLMNALGAGSGAAAAPGAVGDFPMQFASGGMSDVGLAGTAYAGEPVAAGMAGAETVAGLSGWETVGSGLGSSLGAQWGTAAGAGLGAGAGTVAGTALSRVLDGSGSTADYMSVLGPLGAAGLGVYGSMQQGDALRDIAAQSRTDRQPFLGKALEWMNDPAAYAAGPGQTSMNAVLRQLSASGGNPIGNPTSLGLATEAGLRDWRNAVTGMANIGLSGQDSRNSLLASAAGADSGIYNALGSGLANVTNPPKSLADVLKELKGIPGMSSLTTLA